MFGLGSALTFLLIPAGAFARVGEGAYPLVERSLQTQEINATELEYFMLTFSFQSPPKRLEHFWVDLYDTDGWLPGNSTDTVGNALSRFLVAEMNARYTHESIKKIDVDVVAQSTITSSRRKWRRGLQSIGSELKTELTVVFRNEPSPDTAEVESLVSEVMSNLTFFVSNITDLGQGDEELAYIHRAERKSIGGFDESDFDDEFVIPGPPDGITGPAPAPEENGVSLALVMTCVAGALVVLASIALYSVRSSRRRPKPIDDAHNAGLGQINVFLGDEDEDDIFSFEAALIESPAVSAISRRSEMSYSQSQMSSEGSDLFSGIDSQLTSPRESKSVFSFLSGQKSEGSSTVVASNTTKDRPTHIHAKLSTTPKQKLASLLTFSEEEEEDLDSDMSSEDNVPLVPGAILKPHRRIKKDENTELQTQNSPTNGTTKVVGVAKVTFAENEASTFATRPSSAQTSQSESSNTTNSTLPREPLSPSSSTTPPAESFNTRWHNSTFPSTNVCGSHHEPKDSQGAGTISTLSSDATTRHQTSETTRDSVSDMSPAETSDTGSAGSREVNLAWNNPSDSDRNAAMAADFVRTAKSTTPSKKGASKSPVKRVFRSPKSPKSPRTPAGSPGFSPGGRRRNQKGRRHAKSTSADGSKNYQHETMQQRDEGLASFDAVSLSSDSDPSTSGHEPKTPQSATTPNSENKSFFSLSSSGTTDSDGSTSKKLLNDLVWLEKKIAVATNKNSSGGDMSESDAGTPSNRKIEQMDSLSFASNDMGEEMSINTSSPDKNRPPDEKPKGVSAIVCRDCFAPPGKLRIVIHSTKDGPAVHTVKSGSSLSGHVYSGDLIISVDDVDTRSFTAEQVMKMMTARNKYQRKITVLHFETETK